MATNETKVILSAEDRTKAAFDSVARNLGGLEKNFGAINDLAGRLPVLGTAITAAFGAVSFGGLIKGTLDYTAGLHDMAMQTGASVETLSALRNVSELNGVSLEQTAGALGKLAKNMGEAARGSKEQTANFKQLGVSVTDASGNLRDSGDVMLDVAKAIAEIESPTDRVAAATAVLGKSGRELVPMLMDMAEQGTLVATVTAEQARAADELADNLTKIQQNVRDAGQAMGNALLPQLNEFLKANLEGVKIAGSFGEMLRLFVFNLDAMTTEKPVEQINRLTAALKEYQAAGELGKFMQSPTGYLFGGREDDLKKQIEFLKYLQRTDIEKNTAALGDIRDARDRQIEEAKRPTGRFSAAPEADARANAPRVARERTESAADIAAQMPDWIKTRQSDKWMDILKRQEEDADKLAQRYKDLADPLAKYRRELEQIAELRERQDDGGNMLLTAEQAAAAEQSVLKSMADTANAMAGIKETGKDTFSELTDAVNGWGNAFTDSLAEMVMNGKLSFGSLAESIIKDLLRMQIQANITKPLLGMGGEFLSRLFSSSSATSSTFQSTASSMADFGFADGGVPGGPGLAAYANTIVSSPTLFKFAAGGAFRTGLMGEAGEEGILPLTRINGKLGVHAVGGGSAPVININIKNDAGAQVTATARNNDAGIDIDVLVTRAITNDMARNGPISQGMMAMTGSRRASF